MLFNYVVSNVSVVVGKLVKDVVSVVN